MMGKPAINEMDELEMAAPGRVLMDIGTKGDEKLADVTPPTKQLGNELETLNYLGPRKYEHYGVAGGFGAKQCLHKRQC